jgi:glyoxylase-like metal-dependent hydrolase (beta-lactamase superfamily II)
MTYNGTNSWLVDWKDGTVLIDPGSDDEAHLGAILAEARGRLTHILLTHTHRDHLDGAIVLSQRAGAPIAGFRTSADPGFDADIKLEDGDRIGGLSVLHTPGHAMDHLCFARDDGVIFSGDHVMGWSTSVVPPPPYGDLVLFIANLERVRDRHDQLMLSAHGAAIPRPFETVQALIEHRLARERSIAALLTAEPRPIDALLSRAYINLKPELLGPARANLLSHLTKLQGDGRAECSQAGWRSAS